MAVVEKYYYFTVLDSSIFNQAMPRKAKGKKHDINRSFKNTFLMFTLTFKISRIKPEKINWIHIALNKLFDDSSLTFYYEVLLL